MDSYSYYSRLNKPTPSSLELDTSTVIITTSIWEIPVFYLVISYDNSVEQGQ